MGALAALFLMIFWAVFFAAGAAFYFLPTIIAATQHRTNLPLVAIVNFFLGWSFVGWIVALVMALTKESVPVQVIYVPQPEYRPARTVPGSQIMRVDNRPSDREVEPRTQSNPALDR